MINAPNKQANNLLLILLNPKTNIPIPKKMKLHFPNDEVQKCKFGNNKTNSTIVRL